MAAKRRHSPSSDGYTEGVSHPGAGQPFWLGHLSLLGLGTVRRCGSHGAGEQSLRGARSLVLAVTVLLASSVETSGGLRPPEPTFAIDARLLRNGDLIFRQGRSTVSRLVLLADTQSIYSHVGLLLLDGPEALVVHAVPAEMIGDPAPVRAEPLAHFIDAERASTVSVRRLNHSQANRYASLATAAAREYVQEALPFDAGFYLYSGDRLYCTELVWRAYLEAGIDLVDGKFARLETPIGAGVYLTVSALLNSRHLREITSL